MKIFSSILFWKWFFEFVFVNIPDLWGNLSPYTLLLWWWLTALLSDNLVIRFLFVVFDPDGRTDFIETLLISVEPCEKEILAPMMPLDMNLFSFEGETIGQSSFYRDLRIIVESFSEF